MTYIMKALINKKERKTIEFENISEIEEIADKLIGLDPIRDMLARNPFVKKKGRMNKGAPLVDVWESTDMLCTQPFRILVVNKNSFAVQQKEEVPTV